MNNRGTGAGGKNTNINGKTFEKITDNTINLINNGFINKKYYLIKKYEDYKIINTSQNNFKKYIKNKFNIDIFRNPDDAYIIKFNNYINKPIIKILEKKNQNMEGSVETKLWSGPSLKREYEIVFGENFIIEYAYCINYFLQQKLSSNNKKYTILNEILNENNIITLYGNDDNYYSKLNDWINNF